MRSLLSNADRLHSPPNEAAFLRKAPKEPVSKGAAGAPAPQDARGSIMADSPRRYRRYLRYSTVGLELGLSVLLGLVVGQWLDGYFGTEPWLLLLFLLFGMVAGFRSLFRLLRDVNRPDDEEER
jgi:ATP synthase protein I